MSVFLIRGLVTIQDPQASRSDSTRAFSLCTWQVSASLQERSYECQCHLTSKYSMTDVNEGCIIFCVTQKGLLPRSQTPVQFCLGSAISVKVNEIALVFQTLQL